MLTGKQIHEKIVQRKDQEKAAKKEATQGHLFCSKEHEFEVLASEARNSIGLVSLEEIDAEIARSRARRTDARKGKSHA